MQVILLCSQAIALEPFLQFQRQRYASHDTRDASVGIATCPDRLQVLATNDPNDPILQSYCHAWENLRTERGEASRYNDSATFLRSLSRFSPGFPIPFVALFTQDGKVLQGLLIGSLNYSAASYHLGGIELRSLKMQSIGIPETGILCDQQPETVRAIARYLQILTNFADYVELTNFLTQQALFSPLMQAMQTTGFQTLEPKVHWRTQLLDPFTNERLQHLSSKQRYNIRRSEKKLSETFEHGISLVKLQTEAEIERFLDQALVVAKQSYQSALAGVGVSEQPAFRDYLKELAQRGLIRGYLLQGGETAIAYALGDVCQKQFNFWATAFVSDYRKYSPGIVLIQKVHDDLAAEGIQVFDFGWGEAEYKRMMGSECRQEADIRCYNKRWKPLFAYMQDRFLLHLLRSLKSTVQSQSMGQFRAVRSRWRQVMMKIRRDL